MDSQLKHTRIYSRSGDLGETSLYKGPRVGKDHLRIAVVGTLDELNAWLGWTLAEEPSAEIGETLAKLQKKLFVVGCEVSALDPAKNSLRTVCESDVKVLERAIDYWSARVSQVNEFVLPGGSRATSALHVARSICRRAERCAVALLRMDPKFSPRVIAWINRLGDLLFLLARYERFLTHDRETFIEMRDAVREFGDDLIAPDDCDDMNN